jgi:hypothetical protein
LAFYGHGQSTWLYDVKSILMPHVINENKDLKKSKIKKKDDVG